MTDRMQSGHTAGDQKPSLAEVIMQEWKRDNRVREAANDMLAALQFLVSQADNPFLTPKEFASAVKGIASPVIAKATGTES